MSLQVNCPACGGPITFTIGSAIVTVCPYCRSVVARGDRKVEDLGKVAALAETGSPLRLGLKGWYENVPFELVGRAQIGHPAGGVWDEWYAHFANDRWGWLAEAQGRFYFSFPTQRTSQLPDFRDLHLGAPLRLGRGEALIVAEKGTGRYIAAEGQMPYRLVPNETYHYADLSGVNGAFATLDYSEDPPAAFLGREIELDALRLPVTDLRRERETRHGEGVQLACPHCSGPLALRAPDRTQRVTCPNCGSLLDVNQGELKFPQALTPGKVKPAIPLGQVGKLGDLPFTVIGFMQRSVKVEGKRYPWQEYLLYHPQHGFRWLVQSDNHWSQVRPLPPGEVQARGRIATYQGCEFKLFQSGTARVDYVVGEFYWKVTVDEHADTADFIRPPHMLSREVSKGAEASEINWSLGSYWPVEDVERAFSVTGLARPVVWHIAPNQPFLYKGVYAAWAVLSVIAIVLGIALHVMIPAQRVLNQELQLAAMRTGQATATAFSQDFELRGHRVAQIAASLRGNSGPPWVGVDGDVVNQANQRVHPFAMPVTRGQTASVYLSALPAGTYRLRVTGHEQGSSQPLALQITVLEQLPRGRYLFFALLALAIVPGCVLVYHYLFEQARWRQSDFG